MKSEGAVVLVAHGRRSGCISPAQLPAQGREGRQHLQMLSVGHVLENGCSATIQDTVLKSEDSVGLRSVSSLVPHHATLDSKCLFQALRLCFQEPYLYKATLPIAP